MNRPAALAELLQALLRQRHDSFEIVVVDQSTRQDAQAWAVVDGLAQDPRVVMLRHPPLGGPRARNEGCRAARGDILVFIDDDDLPGGDDWFAAHERNFADPKCLAVTGRFVVEGKPGKPYPNMGAAERHVLTFNWLKWQRVYARVNVRKRVESAMGGNAAWRRSTLVRFGLWDECTPVEDEPSLCYRVMAGKLPDEYFLFDNAPFMIRRLNVQGGMNKRYISQFAYGQKLFVFFHNIIGHYFPWRFRLAYPVYGLFFVAKVLEWLIADSQRHRSWPHKLGGTLWFLAALPVMYVVWLVDWWRSRRACPGRAPRLDANA